MDTDRYRELCSSNGECTLRPTRTTERRSPKGVEKEGNRKTRIPTTTETRIIGTL